MTEQEFFTRLQAGEDFNDLVQEAALRNLASEAVRNNQNAFGTSPLEGNLGAGVTSQSGSPV